MTLTDLSRIPNNTLASRNGEAIEEIARPLIPGIHFLHGLFDAEFEGAPLEIKSCQAVITDHSHANTRKRSGRFLFNRQQHDALQEAGGECLFVVHEAGIPKISFRTAAEQVELSEFSGSKCVAWRSVARKFVEVIR